MWPLRNTKGCNTAREQATSANRGPTGGSETKEQEEAVTALGKAGRLMLHGSHEDLGRRLTRRAHGFALEYPEGHTLGSPPSQAAPFGCC